MVQDKQEKEVSLSSVLGRQNITSSGLLSPVIERVTGMKKLKDVYDTNLKHCSEDEFLRKAIKALKINYEFNEESLKNIPSSGPAIIVANHPFGVQDAILLNTIISKVRNDYKIMANSFFGSVKPLRQKMILVDAFQNRNVKNLASMKKSIQLLKNGGALGVFPAGSVSHLEFENRHFTDSEWSETIAGLVAITGAPVVPIYFSGRNSLTFNMAGLLHEKLRTMLLPREAIRPKKKIEVKIGKQIKGSYLQTFKSRRKMSDYLKMRCYLLQNYSYDKEDSTIKRQFKKIAPSLPVSDLQKEIDALPASRKLIDYKEFSVYCTKSREIPSILHEIGRLREVTFREVEEGSGKEIDLDHFDETYLHLFIWNNDQKEIVGAYRMGEVDILSKSGVESLYTSMFYKYDYKFLDDHQYALEMGRSFIRKEYQRKPYSLLLLWRGICSYIARNPKYRYLFGAVSMSDDYDPRSRALTAALLLDRKKQLKSKFPVDIKMNSEVRSFCNKYNFEDSKDLSELVKGIEKDGKDIPVLIKQYMKLGGRFHSFSVDQDFGNTLDGLIVVDLIKAPVKSLKQYMGDGVDGYLEYHSKNFS